MDNSIDLDLDLDLDLTVSLDDEEDEPDPLAGIVYTGDVEADTKAETGAIKNAFAARAKREADRMRKATDSEYWLCVCFQSREQVEEFLRLSRWAKAGAKYIDGQKLAKQLSVPITPEAPLPLNHGRIDKKFADMSEEA